MTLVEVLIAAVILSMMMTALVTGLSTFARSYANLERASEETAEIREVERFLRKILHNAINSPGLFSADSNSLQWVAPLDRAGSAAGLQHFKLFLASEGLTLRLAPYFPGIDESEPPAWSSVVPDTLLSKNIDLFKISIRSNPDASWEDPSTASDEGNLLPLSVKIEWSVDQMAIPPLIAVFDRYGFVQ